MTKTDIGILSVGSSNYDSKTEPKRINGYKVGMKSIPALFWKEMSPANGQKETKEKAGND